MTVASRAMRSATITLSSSTLTMLAATVNQPATVSESIFIGPFEADTEAFFYGSILPAPLALLARRCGVSGGRRCAARGSVWPDHPTSLEHDPGTRWNGVTWG
jgi:hypothetical protein